MALSKWWKWIGLMWAAAACSGAPVRIGNPLLARYPAGEDARPRSIWDLHTFDGRIYIGHGDYWFNRGPIDLWTYGGDGTSFVKEYTVAEEMVWDFIEHEGALYIPGFDAIGVKNVANLYIRDPQGPAARRWLRRQTLAGGIHSFDVAPYLGKLYASITETGGARTLVSADHGRTWQTFLPQYSSFVVFDDFLFLEGDQCYTYDGRTLRRVAPQLRVPMLSMSRRVRFRDGLLYSYPLRYGLDESPLYYITADEIARGGTATVVSAFADAQVRDLVVRGGTCYVLTATAIRPDDRYRGSIHSSEDLRRWTLASRFDVPGIPLSFEILNDRFYVGLGSRLDPAQGWEKLVGPEAGSLWEVGPVFGNLRAHPRLAKRGGMAKLTFTAPRNLARRPVVKVNGQPAVFLGRSGNQYQYRYALRAADVDGAAVVSIAGTDRAGNPGRLRSRSALALDQTVPRGTLSRTGASPTYAAEVTFNLDFSEPVTGCEARDLRLGGSAPGKTVKSFAARSSRSYQVTVGVAGAGSVTLALASNRCADAAGNANGAAATVEYVVAKRRVSPVLDGLDRIYTGAAHPAAVTTVPPGLPVIVTYGGVPSAPTNAGSYGVVARIDSPWYEGAATGVLVVAKAAQTIDFPAPGPQVTTNATELTATSSSGLPVSYVVEAGPGRIEAGGILRFTGAGTVTVVALQPGDANRLAAPAATNSMAVTKAQAAVVLTGLERIYDGTPGVVTATTEPPGLPVVVTYADSAAAPTEVGTYAVTAEIVDPIWAGSAAGTLVISPAPDPFALWLAGRGLSAADPRYAPGADDDGDGAVTEAEYVADTDPANRDSVLRVTGDYEPAAGPGATGTLRLAFPASTNRYYQLAYRTNLLMSGMGVSNLGWGVSGMVATSPAAGQWFGAIRARLAPP